MPDENEDQQDQPPETETETETETEESTIPEPEPDYHAEFLALCDGSEEESQAAQDVVLKTNRNLLPESVLLVLDGAEPTNAYWRYLVDIHST